MIVTAITKDGVLIAASKNEVLEIINAVTGAKPKEVAIGQRLPAIDYASTITKIKSLENDYAFTQLTSSVDRIASYMDVLKKSVKDASQITL